MKNMILKATLLTFLFCSISISHATPLQEPASTILSMTIDNNRAIPGNKRLIKVTFTSSHPTDYELHIGINGTYFTAPANSYSGSSVPNTYTYSFIVDGNDYFLHPKLGAIVTINCGLMGYSNYTWDFLREDSCIVTIGPGCC